MRYWYEAHTGDGYVDASSDEEAMKLIRDKFGEHLLDVIIVSVQESEHVERTVWLE